MANTSLKKRVARLVRKTKAKLSPLFWFPETSQVKWGGGQKGAHRLAAFWHAVLRLDSMAARLKRIETGWNQHVPALLDSVSLALGEARAAGQVHDRIDAVREEMDRLALRLDLTLADFGARLATVERPEGGLDHGIGRTVVGAMGAQAGRFDLYLARRRVPSPDRVVVTLAGAAGTQLTLGADADLPFGFETVRSITVATDFLFSPGQNLETTILSWLRILEPGGVCIVERFYVADLLDELDGQRLGMTEARGIAASRTPSHPGVSTSDLAQAMKSCGYDPVHVVRGDSHDLVVRGTRPVLGLVD